MNKTRPYRLYFRVNQEELDWIKKQVSESGETMQNYLLHKVVTPDSNGGDTEETAENKNPTKTCPKCGAPLILRNGYRGKFWGCSNYPNCRYTEDWKGD